MNGLKKVLKHLNHQNVVAMVNSAYEVIDRYFNVLSSEGYYKQSEVNKMIVYLTIQELIDGDFRALINPADYSLIIKALYCLYDSSCLLDYPQYFNPNNRRIMYTGSMSELSHRVEVLENKTEELNNTIEAYGDTEIVLPEPSLDEDNTETED